MGILSSIKRRSDSEKNVFSFFTAIIFTLVIVGVWFSFKSAYSNNQANGEKENKLSSLNPVQVIKDEFSRAFSNTKTDQVSNSAALIEVPVEDLSKPFVVSTTTIISTSTTDINSIATSTATKTSSSTNSKKIN